MVEDDFKVDDEEQDTEPDFDDEDEEVEDLDEIRTSETQEAELISASEGFMEHFEAGFNEDILDRQGIRQVGTKFKFTGLDGVEYELSMKQKLFAEAYLSFKGNSVDAIISAGYDVRKKDDKGNPINNVYNRKLASVLASQNLGKLNICAYMRTLYERYGFSDEAVEREHLFLINQNEDLKTKARAIDMFYDLKAKYPAKKLDLGDLGEGIIGITYVKPTDKQDATTAESAGVADSSKA